jgi:hypothetical protein
MSLQSLDIPMDTADSLYQFVTSWVLITHPQFVFWEHNPVCEVNHTSCIAANFFDIEATSHAYTMSDWH